MVLLSRRLALLLCVVALVAACGKKGAPLPPIVRIPSAVDPIAAVRVGDDIYLSMVVPATNIDGSTPVDIERIDIYGYTGATPPPTGRFLEVAALVATVPIASAAAPVAPTGPSDTPAGTGAVVQPNGATTGATVTIVDTLTPDEREQGATVAAIPLRSPALVPPGAVEPSTPGSGPLRRFYLAVPFSSRGRPGPQPAPAELALFDPPAAPGPVTLTATPTGLVLNWEPAGGLLGFLFDRGLAPEADPSRDVFAVAPAAPAIAAATAPAGPTRYNVYLTPSPAAAPLATPPVPQLPWLRSPGAPINPAPLGAPTFTDILEFGRERCYAVRAVRGTAPDLLESAASEPVCVTPVDTFPPAPPAELIAVAAEGGISLLWEPGSDFDLAGYIVLRGAPGDATLLPLTPMPITESRFVDATVVAGTRYVYAVVAVDTALPTPNMSPESPRIEETAR